MSLDLAASLPVTVQCADSTAGFRVTELTWNEKLGAPFEAELNLIADDYQIDMSQLLTKPMAVRIDKPNGDPTYLNGFIDRMEYLGSEQRYSRYSVSLAPCISFLKYSGGCRIFQNMPVPAIIKLVMAEHGYSGQVTLSLTGPYLPREYCVQYGESDFNFVSRLMQQEGIYYYFTYTNEQHNLVLVDNIGAHLAVEGNESLDYLPWDDARADEFAHNLRVVNKCGTNAVTLGDYDFTSPQAMLNALQLSSSGQSSPRQYNYPGGYEDLERGVFLARIQQQSNDARKAWGLLNSNCRALRCGNVFTLAGHEDEKFNIDYLIVESNIYATQSRGQANTNDEFAFDTELKIQDKTIPYRPVITADRPQVYGPQVATVCGRAGEDIWTDEYGRVKVQFPWDRIGQSNENSSCWLRVAQPWTGSSWGAMSVPRIGEEVIVEFMDGDPDRPVIIGRVYNADQMPPEDLSENQAKTVFRTRSTQNGDQTNFHELTFDDTKDSELIYLHSERDFNRVVENNDTQQIGFDKQEPGDQEIQVYNDRNLEVGVGSGSGSMSVTVEQDRSVVLNQGNDSLSVAQGDISVEADAGDISTKATAGDISTEASAGQINLTAAKSIVLTCGQSKITISPDSIELSAAQISLAATASLKMQGASSTLQADGQLQLKGAIGSLQADGPLTVKGAIVQIN